MNSPASKRHDRLLALAKSDRFYQLMCDIHEKNSQAYVEFFSKQSPEVQSMLWGYVNGELFSNQWLIKIACDHMCFPDESDTL